MCKARDLNQSPSRPHSAVAYVSDAINSVKRKELLGCHFAQQIRCRICFLENTNNAEIRQSSLQALAALGALAPPRPPKGGLCFQVGVTETAGPCSSQRDRATHRGFCIAGPAMVPSSQVDEETTCVGVKGEVDHRCILFFFHITVLLARPSRAAFLDTDIWGWGRSSGVNSHCLQELQVGSLAQNSV